MISAIETLMSLYHSQKLRGATLITKPNRHALEEISTGNQQRLFEGTNIDPVFINCINIYKSDTFIVYVVDVFDFLYLCTGGKNETQITIDDYFDHEARFSELLSFLLEDLSEEVIDVIQFEFSAHELERYLNAELEFADLVSFTGLTGHHFWEHVGISKGVYSHLMQQDSRLTTRNAALIEDAFPLIQLSQFKFKE